MRERLSLASWPVALSLWLLERLLDRQGIDNVIIDVLLLGGVVLLLLLATGLVLLPRSIQTVEATPTLYVPPSKSTPRRKPALVTKIFIGSTTVVLAFGLILSAVLIPFIVYDLVTTTNPEIPCFRETTEGLALDSSGDTLIRAPTFLEPRLQFVDPQNPQTPGDAGFALAIKPCD